jgi:hypothetical protein
MAAAPEGAVPLQFEDEEAAILRAVREPAAVIGIIDAQKCAALSRIEPRRRRSPSTSSTGGRSPALAPPLAATDAT